MILLTCFLLVLSVACKVSGASVSHVFMQTGPEIAPAVEYLQYGAPTYAAPVGLEYPFPQPFSYRAPCAEPACFYPGQQIASVAPVIPSSNVLTYAVPGNNGPISNGYEYFYVIVNQNADDHKLHSELSDGGAVRGKYSLLQPDGTVREVQYVSDDSQGFNAVVNFLPVDEVKLTEIVQNTPPCPEVKSEALTAHEERHGNHEEPNALENLNEKPEAKNLENSEAQVVIEGEELPENHLKAHHEGQEIEERTPENVEDHSHPTHEKIVETTHTEVAPHESHHVGQQAPTQHKGVESNIYVSYNDIIKCIQAAMTKANTHPSASRPLSPLTYLILNKPC